MSFRLLTPDVRVWGQITPDDVARARDLGVTLIINNRPDGEDPGQPASAQVEAWARSAGLAYAWAPISGRPTRADAAAMADLLETADSVLIYCRSGMRSTAAWAMARTASGAMSPDAARAAAAEAGYDLSGLPL
ncbi:MAG: TIGR01244 family sulfur transferase [Brevundimonas sp.]|uniref:TIGR01244 family sulfur transferase n=1 Tax=Brevundimonas sp. TaxID=1871086 RepID=UPI00391C1C67